MKLHFHPVWEQTLPSKGKAELTAAFTAIPPSHSFNASPYLIKRKRNGGIVATVFLQNGTAYPISLDHVQVQLEQQKMRLAQHNFDESLVIPPNSTMPWSFVFPPESTEEGDISELITISIDLLK